MHSPAIREPLKLRVIGRDIPNAELPPRLYRGPVSKARYATLCDPAHELAACIHPGHWQTMARLYLEKADLAGHARQAWEKSEDGKTVYWTSGSVTLESETALDTLIGYVQDHFPKGMFRANFAANLFGAIRPMVEQEQAPLRLFTIFKPFGKGAILHSDLQTERRGILTLPQPGAQSTWLDISEGGLGFSGQEAATGALPGWPEAHREHLAALAAGDLLIASGQEMPKAKWAGHAEPTLPAATKGRFVTLVNLAPRN